MMNKLNIKKRIDYGVLDIDVDSGELPGFSIQMRHRIVLQVYFNYEFNSIIVSPMNLNTVGDLNQHKVNNADNSMEGKVNLNVQAHKIEMESGLGVITIKDRLTKDTQGLDIYVLENKVARVELNYITQTFDIFTWDEGINHPSTNENSYRLPYEL